MAEVKKRNNSLDMLKMISIIMVIIIHSLGRKEYAMNGTLTMLTPILTAFAVPVFIVISGYLRTKKITKIGVKGAYNPKYMWVSFMSLMLAYLFVVVIQILGCLPFKLTGKPLPLGATFLDSVPDFLLWFVMGSSGKVLAFGSYYIPIMVELIVFFPLVYLLFKKNKHVGLIACFIINLAYDSLTYYFGMSELLYRYLIFRYTFMIGMGIYLGLQKEFDKKSDIVAAIFFVIGLAFVIVNGYVYQVPIFIGTWGTSSMGVAPFAYGYVYFMMKWFKNIKEHKIFVFGKASYHIYLIQMTFFFFYGNNILQAIFGRLNIVLSTIVQIVIAIVLTFGIGVGFYFVETKLRRALHISH